MAATRHVLSKVTAGTPTGVVTYYVCPLTSDIPSSGLVAGDLVFDQEAGVLYTATDATSTSPVGSGDPGPEGPAGPSGAVTGEIKMWPTDTAPTGYLLCDGSAVSRVTYLTLFVLIGETYGVGNGTTTFNVPNLKGKVPVGLDSGQTEFDAIAETGGAKTHTLLTAEMPSHGHTQDSHNHTQNAHNHIITSQTATTGSATSYEHGTLDTSSADAEATEVTADTTAVNQAATATNQNTGGGGAHNNLQPYLVLNFIIKT